MKFYTRDPFDSYNDKNFWHDKILILFLDKISDHFNIIEQN